MSKTKEKLKTVRVTCGNCDKTNEFAITEDKNLMWLVDNETCPDCKRLYKANDKGNLWFL